MNEIDDAIAALAAPGLKLAEAEAEVPHKPGLYAFGGSAATWISLGLGSPPDERPLYVGKAERSLASRDVRTHFSTGRTGSSTLRRTLAGLLRDQLGLVAVPRNPRKPDNSANFGLDLPGDERLSAWMKEHLRLSVWVPPDRIERLDAVETAVLNELLPPLNLSKVRTPWRAGVAAGRASLAAQARASFSAVEQGSAGSPADSPIMDAPVIDPGPADR